METTKAQQVKERFRQKSICLDETYHGRFGFLSTFGTYKGKVDTLFGTLYEVEIDAASNTSIYFNSEGQQTDITGAVVADDGKDYPKRYRLHETTVDERLLQFRVEYEHWWGREPIQEEISAARRRYESM